LNSPPNMPLVLVVLPLIPNGRLFSISIPKQFNVESAMSRNVTCETAGFGLVEIPLFWRDLGHVRPRSANGHSHDKIT